MEIQSGGNNLQKNSRTDCHKLQVSIPKARGTISVHFLSFWVHWGFN